MRHFLLRLSRRFASRDSRSLKMFDNPHNLCFSNFNGRRLRTPKRLFPEIAVNYDGFPSCAKCGNVEQDHNGLQNGLCLECRKGEVCISVSHVASPSSMGQSVSMERSIASTNSPSSPPESDSPESEKREFRVGDLVECLPDGDAESSKLRAPRRNW